MPNKNHILIEKVKRFCISNDFETLFEEFFKEHLDIFMDACDRKEKGTENGFEHDLRYTEIYEEYLNIFEKKISDFIEKEGYSVVDFTKECEEIFRKENEEEKDDTIMNSKKSNQFFIETLISLSSYEEFFNLMIQEVKNYRRLQKSRK